MRPKDLNGWHAEMNADLRRRQAEVPSVSPFWHWERVDRHTTVHLEHTTACFPHDVGPSSVCAFLTAAFIEGTCPELFTITPRSARVA